MSAPDAIVVAILREAAAHLAAIRTANNGEDHDEVMAAERSLVQLFAHGMIDRWRAEDGEDPPAPEDVDELNGEVLEPGADWSAATVALFHRVCGDVCFLHSNDAGLNAAMANYEKAAIGLAADDPVGAALCVARMMRAACYASYLGDFAFERAPMLVRALEAVASAPPLARDEVELSLVEATARMQSFPPAGDAAFDDVVIGAFLRDPPDDVAAVAARFRVLLLERLHALCARTERLPFRRSIPWLTVARWAGTAMLPERELAPFFALLGTKGTSGIDDLVLAAADRAVLVEDGAFYPHGGALAPKEYVDATREGADHLRLDVLVGRGSADAVVVADRLLAALHAESFHDAGRAALSGKRVRALYACRALADAHAAALAYVAWLEARVDAHWWSLPALAEDVGAIELSAGAHGHDDVVAAIMRLVATREAAAEARQKRIRAEVDALLSREDDDD